MSKKIFYSIFLTVLLAVIISTVLTVNYFILAWSEPTDDPPGGTSGMVLGRWSEGTTPGEIYYDSGNVGMGTPNPDALLEIEGGNLIIDKSAATLYLGYGADGGPHGIIFADDSGTNQLQFVYRSSPNQLIVEHADTGADLFWLDDDTDYAYFSGNVGIGEPIPGEKLEVSGNVQATAFLYSSDESLKKNIQIIPNALEKVMALDGIQFEWIENSESGIGLIAQDVEKVFPELVNTNEQSGLKTLQYGNLVAPLIEAIKEQQQQIKALEKEIEVLKNR